jgi:hypothetical protein
MEKILKQLAELKENLLSDFGQGYAGQVELIIKNLQNISSQLEPLVMRFVGGSEPLTVGKLKKIIAELDDDFTIDMRVRTRLTDEQLKNSSYPYPYHTEYTQLEFDDIGYSDKQLCLGCEIANKHA